MGIELRSPAVGELSDVVRVLREWQHADAPMQLHPGDLGWFWQFGAEATAAAVRTWSLAGQIVAVGLLDSPKLLRHAQERGGMPVSISSPATRTLRPSPWKARWSPISLTPS